jgi:hypothetical protein
VKRVVGHLVLTDVSPNVFVGPVGEWTDLEPPLVGRVDLEESGIGPGARLPSAEPGNPGIRPGERAGERGELANRAALFAILD